MSVLVLNGGDDKRNEVQRTNYRPAGTPDTPRSVAALSQTKPSRTIHETVAHFTQAFVRSLALHRHVASVLKPRTSVSFKTETKCVCYESGKPYPGA